MRPTSSAPGRTAGGATGRVPRAACSTGWPRCPARSPDRTAATWCDDVVAVVEGQARDVPAPDGVRVERAAGSGDDALAAYAARLAEEGTPTVVVTADRGLRARLPASAVVAGPGWLLGRLDEIGRAPQE